MMAYGDLGEGRFCQLQGGMIGHRVTQRRDGAGMNDGTVLPYIRWFVIAKPTSP